MLKKIPRENIDLLFTDTDSLCYEIRHNDIFQIIKENKEHFDLSNYNKDSEFYDKTNAKVVNKMKNESPNHQITEFIGLRSKLYAYSVDNNDEEHLKCKGVKTCVVKKDLNMEKYRKVLFENTKEIIEQNSIRSYGHQLYTEKITKIGLSSNDDKVYICENKIDTFNFGYDYKEEEIKNNV